MEDENDAAPTNPYMALRAEKIARNEARLKELGLYKAKFSTATSQSSKPVSIRKRKPGDQPPLTAPTRRSLRISGLPINPNYVESKDFKERAALPKEHSNDDFVQATEDRIRQKKTTPSRAPSGPAPASVNSVRTISLDASVVVQKFLAKPLEIFGKYFVIQSSFEEAACEDDKARLAGVSRLSFNKFSGVQPWKNVIYLWINVGGPTDPNSLVNEFTSNGSRVSWFGGSKMREDSPIILTLIQMGKEAASDPSSTSSGIVLWCRQYDWNTKKLLPYTCLGRLAYESHIPGSYPVAFTWRLMDYESMMGNKATRDVFYEISGSEPSK